MNKYVRKAVNFNVSNTHQNEIYEWVTQQSNGNFSGYVKTVLYAHMVKSRQDAAALTERYNKPSI